jgi:hypothetical protein
MAHPPCCKAANPVLLESGPSCLLHDETGIFPYNPIVSRRLIGLLSCDNKAVKHLCAAKKFCA